MKKNNEYDSKLKAVEEGNAWNDSDEVVRITAGQPLDKVIPVRLPAAEWEQLRKEARAIGIGPTTLARMWILERLRSRPVYLQDVLRSLQLTGTSSSDDAFTIREKTIFSYLAQGQNAEQIADELGTTPEEVQNDIRSLQNKVTRSQG